MLDYLAKLPEQFKGKPNIAAILRACQNQACELQKVYAVLNSLTALDTASGVQLDRVGQRYGLSRCKAEEISGRAIEDQIYRAFLKCWSYGNHSTTYAHLAQALHGLYGDDVAFAYTENGNAEFTIAVTTPHSIGGDPLASLLPTAPGIKMNYSVTIGA